MCFISLRGKNTISKTVSNDVTLPPIVVPRLTQCKVASEYCDLKGKNTPRLLSVTLAKKKKKCIAQYQLFPLLIV